MPPEQYLKPDMTVLIINTGRVTRPTPKWREINGNDPHCPFFLERGRKSRDASKMKGNIQHVF